ncbi:MAG: DedA family protein [Prevotella sp.]|jgi:membrane protein YqaA with SNARE-associated domain|nr:DedA family protein [Prevotella sp.]
MDALTDLLVNYGYWGMLIAAFVAGSFFPFSSEAVMVGLLYYGLEPWPLAIYGTLGNWLGSMFNYGVGHMGKIEWIERYLHVKKETLDKAQRFLGGRGAWMGFFAFLPLIGTAISILLGLMRANLPITAFSTLVGKLLRYVLVMQGANLLF